MADEQIPTVKHEEPQTQPPAEQAPAPKAPDDEKPQAEEPEAEASVELAEAVHYRDPNFPEEEMLRAAIVTRVNKDGTVSLTVFYRNHTDTAHDVKEGDEPGQFRTV